MKLYEKKISFKCTKWTNISRNSNESLTNHIKTIAIEKNKKTNQSDV